MDLRWKQKARFGIKFGHEIHPYAAGETPMAEAAAYGLYKKIKNSIISKNNASIFSAGIIRGLGEKPKPALPRLRFCSVLFYRFLRLRKSSGR